MESSGYCMVQNSKHKSLKSIDEKQIASDDRKLFIQALEVASNGIMITDVDGVIVWANSAVLNLTGYSQSELIGEKPSIFRSGIHDDSMYNDLWTTITKGENWRGELVNRKKDGSFYFEELTITPIKDKSGNITNFITIKQDITNKRFKMNQLEQSEASMQLIMNTLPAVIWLVDTNLMFVSAYGSALDAFGISASEMIGETIFDFFESDDPDNLPIHAHINALEGESFKFDYELKKNTIECYVEPYYDSKKKIVGCVGIGYDVTQRVKHENQLIEAKRLAEKSDKMKSEFLSQMSHEIRTPLNVIVNFLDLLEEDIVTTDDSDLAEGLAMMKASSNRITRTINLLLNMSEIQSGTYEYNEETFDLLDEIIMPCFREYEIDAKQKGLQFSIVKDTHLSFVKSDKYSINEIVRNLVDNAIKYTKEGSVKIILTASDSDLIICVSDTGIGISEEYKNRLFEIFSQEDHGYTRRFEGNGLGLALIKKYCSLNKIEIDFESRKEKGTDFWITFPAEKIIKDI